MSAVEETKVSSESRVKKKNRKNVPLAVVHISATFNNTFVTFSDLQGNTIAWSVAGMLGFKGSRKSTPYAAQMTAEDAAKKAMEHGVRTVSVKIKGPGSGRESAIRALMSVGLVVTGIHDITPVAHNGCRPAKRRKV